MVRSLVLSCLGAALAFGAAHAQAPFGPGALPGSGAISSSGQASSVTPQQVQLIAPQLVGFAGSDANFQSLVLGLAQGTPITLVTPLPGGLVQVATFTPP